MIVVCLHIVEMHNVGRYPNIMINVPFSARWQLVSDNEYHFNHCLAEFNSQNTFAFCIIYYNYYDTGSWNPSYFMLKNMAADVLATCMGQGISSHVFSASERFIDIAGFGLWLPSY